MQPQEPQQQQVPDSMNPGDGQPMDTDQPCQPDSGVDTSDNDKKHYMVVIGYMLTHAGLFNIFFGAMSVYMTSLPYNFEWFLQVLCGVPVVVTGFVCIGTTVGDGICAIVTLMMLTVSALATGGQFSMSAISAVTTRTGCFVRVAHDSDCPPLMLENGTGGEFYMSAISAVTTPTDCIHRYVRTSDCIQFVMGILMSVISAIEFIPCFIGLIRVCVISKCIRSCPSAFTKLCAGLQKVTVLIKQKLSPALGNFQTTIQPPTKTTPAGEQLVTVIIEQKLPMQSAVTPQLPNDNPHAYEETAPVSKSPEQPYPDRKY